VSLDETYQRTFAARHQRAIAVGPSPAGPPQSLRERLGVRHADERLDTQVWPDTSAAALNTRAATIGAGTTLTDAQLGTTQFLEYDLVPALRTWDFSNWGDYFGHYLESLALSQPDPLQETLASFAGHLRKGHADAACHQLDNFAKHVTKQGGARPASAPQLEPSVRDDLLGKAQRLEDELGCE
jgi:hypothetical protein